MKLFLNYQRARIKQVNNLLRIEFIENCRQADIIPRFLRFRIPNNGCFEPSVVLNFQRRLLKQELFRAKQLAETHKVSVHEHLTKLREVAKEQWLPSILLHIRYAVAKERVKVVSVHQKKLNMLSKEQARPLRSSLDTVKVVDDDIKPPQYVMDTLALGPKNPVLDKFNPKESLAELDMLLHHCNANNISDDIISEINVATMKYVKACSAQHTPRNLVMTKRYLKENKLLAIPFDKGTGICIMKKDTYRNKLKDILNLEQFEKVIPDRKNAKDAILKEEERINKTLADLRKNNKISESLFDKVKSTGGQPPRLYGLAKVHKASIPLRPVLSMPGSPYYSLANQVEQWISVLPESQINCSTKRVSEVSSQTQLDPDEVMISFDVTALYTNVPVNEAIQLAADKLYSGNPGIQSPPVDKDTFITLANLASKDVVMWTPEGYYRQKDGLAMGSQPAGPLANIWLSQFEPVIKDSAKIFERYVDDIIRSINKHNIAEKLREINSLHPNLKFTIEVQENGRIAFLDLTIINNNGTLSTTWYRKPSDTGLVLNFHATAPVSYKRSVVAGFIHRIYRSCSTWENFHHSLVLAKDILEQNQYPPEFYDPIVSNTIDKLRSAASATNEQFSASEPAATTPKHLYRIQYRGKATDGYVKRLRSVNAPIQPVITLRKLRSFLPSLKEPVPSKLATLLVYKIQCPSCPACYVGWTLSYGILNNA